MPAVIHKAIPGREVRLFGSRARGQAGADADIDLLITAPDSWVDSHHRFEVLNTLWDQLAQADVSLDLLLSSQIECEARRDWRSHVIGRAYREGRLVDEQGCLPGRGTGSPARQQRLGVPQHPDSSGHPLGEPGGRGVAH